MTASINEVRERLDRLPDAHVEKDLVIGEYPNARRVALVRLQTPNESWRGIRKSIYRIQGCHKAGHHWGIEGRFEFHDVALCELKGHTLRLSVTLWGL
jgi:hypothetical protein